ncbi:MAG: 2-dehydropantoate 2-reductase [Spirochaetes bacterium]|nr:2-dehydropantoate 2-reductase [Spirochaetota bacterium]
MKVGIAGAGAMGSIFAYFLNKANIDVVLFEKDNNSIINTKNGFNVITGNDIIKIKIVISSDVSVLKGCNVIILFVKTYDTEEALKKISSEIIFADGKIIIVSLQNGLGNKDIIAKYIPGDMIVYGSTSIGATRVDTSTVRLGGMGNIIIGGSSKASVINVQNIFKAAGLDVLIEENPDEVVWKKAIVNAGINPLGAILGVPNGAIIQNDYLRTLQERIVREAVETACLMGISLNADDLVEQTRSVCEKTSKNLCSMLQDINAKRKTEIDSINGVIIQNGKKNNLPTPYNDAVYCLIKAKEAM